jgi:energy-coupling factor transporter ATP-binding protein EcfA2
MKLVEIEIKNLKSITSALLSFPVDGDHQVSLLYGDNGAGKTTVLEAISLLGHLSTMRRICAGVKVDVTPSRFREYKNSSPELPNSARIAAQSREQYNDAAFKEQCNLLEQEGIEKWWRGAAQGGDPYRPARMRYRVLFKNQKIEFYVSFLQGHDLSITEAIAGSERQGRDHSRRQHG